GYRAARTMGSAARTAPAPGAGAEVVVVTGRFGVSVLGPVLDEFGYEDVELAVVDNAFFGGNIGVTGLLTFADVDARLREVSVDARVLLPDVCLSSGRFLDGEPADALCRTVEIVPCDGASLRRALDRSSSPLRLTATAAP
ncbi:MAG: DUF512 domain-containing protein, partial [Acidimicrobiales bacterium]